jgi:hypothetical protein
MLNFLTIFGGKSTTSQANDIEPGKLVDFVRDTIRGDVLGKRAISLAHSEISNVSELMNGSTASKEDFISNSDVPSYHDIVGENVIISDNNVMSNMGNRHKEISVTNDGISIRFSAPADRDVLPKIIVVSNNYA